jgi:phosphonate degradation associated HDIG domain protein
MITPHAIEEIAQLFHAHGQSAYFGELVSQYEHAAQTALLAEEAGADNDTVIAAFLHDIGHLLPSDTPEERMEDYGRRDHEALAAEWLLERGFSEKTAELIAHHVNAKRYLVYQQPGYFENLSEASRKTLEFQGGIMTPLQADWFEQHPYLEEILQMRYWDEQAKVQDKVLPELGYFLGMMERV